MPRWHHLALASKFSADSVIRDEPAKIASLRNFSDGSYNFGFRCLGWAISARKGAVYMRTIQALWIDRRGAGATEYVLILAVICLTLIASGTNLGLAINTRLSSAASPIANGG